MAHHDPTDQVSRQIAKLTDAKLGRLAASRLRDRHAKIDLHMQRGREALMIARGELIVRAKDAGKVAKLLGRDFTQEPLDLGPLNLVRFAGDVQAARVIDAVRRLRTYRIDASPNAVMTCGMRAKALASPKPTDRPLEVAADPTAGKGAHVIVIDTGIDAAANTRSDKLLSGVAIQRRRDGNVDPLTAINVREGHGPVLDLAAGHGTFVAGVIRQIAPKASVTVIRALNSDGVGTTLQVAEAILVASALQPDVVNMSFATEDPDHANPVAIADALTVARAMSPHTVFVAAAGNSPDSVRTWPATLPGVVAVGGLSADNGPSKWSKRGSWIDVSTRGEGIVSAYVAGTEAEDTDPGYATDSWSGTDPIAVWTGTSFAAPRVAAAIAVEVGKGLSAKRALSKLRRGGTATPKWGDVLEI